MSGAGSPQSRRRGRWPAGFLGLVALVGLIEAGLAPAGADLVSINAANWRLTPALASGGDARAADVLCFGDSAVKTGVSPAVLEARLGCPVYNLATLGATTPASYFLLKRVLDSGARPRAIVFDAKEHQLWMPPRDLIREWARSIGVREAFQLARDEHDPGFFGLYLAHRLPSVLYQPELRAAISARLSGRPIDPAIPWREILDRHLAYNRGAVLLTAGPARVTADPHRRGLPIQATFLYESGSAQRPRPSNMIFIDKFLSLAEAHSIPVFMLIPPLYPGIQQERERVGLDSVYAQMMHKIHDRYPDVVVVDARHSGLGERAFSDSYHLNAEGAVDLSVMLARVMDLRLRAPATTPRWLTLSTRDGAAPRVAAEDLDRSIQAVKSRGEVRR